MFDERLCHMFGDCIRMGNGNILQKDGKLMIYRDRIADMTVLADICPSRALFVAGKEISVTELIEEVEKDIPFYKMSGGGVTISGGEPFAQRPELKELLTGLKNRDVNISAETSLHMPWEIIENYIDAIDVFLADLKHVDNEKFKTYTGGDCNLVLNNFKKLDRTGKKFIVRIPVIPKFNFSDSEMSSIIDFVSELTNVSEINFIPFHSLAREKYNLLGKVYTFGDQRNVAKADITRYIEYAEGKGLAVKILN